MKKDEKSLQSELFAQVGSELVGWLAEEVLRRATFGKWDWVADTLDAMGTTEVLELAEGCCDTEGRSILVTWKRKSFDFPSFSFIFFDFLRFSFISLLISLSFFHNVNGFRGVSPLRSMLP